MFSIAAAPSPSITSVPSIMSSGLPSNDPIIDSIPRTTTRLINPLVMNFFIMISNGFCFVYFKFLVFL